MRHGRAMSFVLVHGAWHGGWCWARLKPLLETAGHRVTAPTLTGLGERRHLISRSVTLYTHVEDVLAHIEMEDLSDIVLVGHSYAGFVVSGVCERAPQAISRVILLDAFVPKNNEAVADYSPSAALYRENAAKDASWNIAPPPVAAFGLSTPLDADWVSRHLTPHPVGTYLQNIRLTHGMGAVSYLAYIACTAPALSVLDITRERVSNDPQWRFVELAAGHDAMVSAPQQLADALLSCLGDGGC